VERTEIISTDEPVPGVVSLTFKLSAAFNAKKSIGRVEIKRKGAGVRNVLHARQRGKLGGETVIERDRLSFRVVAGGTEQPYVKRKQIVRIKSRLSAQ
jgi:hypothetical protein